MRAHILRSLRALPRADASVTCSRPPFSDYDLNRLPRPVGPLRPAAVLVPLVERGVDLTVLLTQRAQHLRDHPGQISFPGGRMEPCDTDPVAAALRETREEVGITSEFITPAGCLDDYETGTGFLVTPVVSFLVPGFALVPDACEVADVFEVPLAFFLDDANRQTHSYVRDGRERHYFVFEYGPRYIWGATAGMLVNLVRRLRGEPGGNRPPQPPAG